MPNPIPLRIEDIYVPAKRKKTLEAEKVDALANDILENGQLTPIRVREGEGAVCVVGGVSPAGGAARVGGGAGDGLCHAGAVALSVAVRPRAIA